jgi:2-aminobenzoate-CoA ligase
MPAADRSSAAARSSRGSFDAVATHRDDPAMIAFTSGTTGRPKGCVHYHRDVLASADSFARYLLKPAEGERWTCSAPIAFTFGLGMILTFPWRFGGTAVTVEQPGPRPLLEAIARHRVDRVATAPTAYKAMLPLLDEHDLSSLTTCVSAGEHLPEATFRKWLDATGIRIIDGIGSTEMLHIFISAAGDDIRPGSTGRAVPGYQARVVDAEGNEVPPGTVGSLAVRGPTGCRYLDDVERQRGYVRRGWNLPGDSYRMDEDGYFWYQARTDDLIVSAGYKIAGPEVENALLDHPAVLECGVVGAPDEERGMIVKAFVVLRPGFEAGEATAKALQEFVKSQIAPYKYPRAVEFVDSLPRTETGKLQRFRLRAAERR